MRKNLGIGPLEGKVLFSLNDLGTGSVKDIHNNLEGELAITTIATVLDRLYKKGLVDREVSTNGYVHYIYKSINLSQIKNKEMLKELIGNFVNTFKEPLISYFASLAEGLDDEERKRITEDMRRILKADRKTVDD